MNSLFFSKKILYWYQQNKRILPWRGINDPYKIWISEVILQQTRVEQGKSYYLRLTNKFPDIFSLANASEDEILKIWQGLGYYSRARNLHKGAKQIVKNFDGVFPDQLMQLKSIAGIGDYTAAAISSIVYKQPVAAIDGNVYRVLSRVFGIETPIDTSAGKKAFAQLADNLIDRDEPGDYNQSVMEFGALQCKPKNPDCSKCPFSEKCYAYINNAIQHLPVKAKTTKQRNRYFNYLVVEKKNTILFKKRESNDIWKNMFDFPLIETLNETTLEELTENSEWKKLFQNDRITINHVSKTYLHQLTHQRIHARFIHFSIINENKLPANFLKIDKRNIFELAVPKIIENYINNEKKFQSII